MCRSARNNGTIYDFGAFNVTTLWHYTTHTHTRTQPFNGPLSGTARVSRYQKGKPNLDFTEAKDNGISWAICKSAPRPRQITTPAPDHSVFCRLDALPAAQPSASKHWRHSAGISPYCSSWRSIYSIVRSYKHQHIYIKNGRPYAGNRPDSIDIDRIVCGEQSLWTVERLSFSYHIIIYRIISVIYSAHVNKWT